MVGKCCQKIFDLRKIFQKHFVTCFMGENFLRKSSEIFLFGKCPVSGNICLRFYYFASSENVQEMRHNREPHRGTSVILQAASRILAMDDNLIDKEDAIASAAMAVTRSRMLAAELVMGESLFDFESGDVCAGSLPYIVAK